MTPKERYLTAMHHGQPDRVPLFDFLFTPDLFEAVNGRRPEVYTAEDAVECTLRLGMDSVWVPADGFAGYSPVQIDDKTYIDEWGTTYQHNGTSWPIDAPIAFPVVDRSDFNNIDWPDPFDPHRTKSLREGLRLADNRVAVLGGVTGPFTQLFFLMGLENACITAYEDPELFHDIMRKCTYYNLNAGLECLKAGADALVISEDLGYNTGTFLSPEMTREFILPYVREMTAAFRKFGAPIMLHCDGNMNALMDDLANLGVDAWQPLERKAQNDLKKVKERYGKKLTLVGNVDSTNVLPFGTREDVMRQTLECLAIGGPGGSYVLGSDHSLHDGIPVENIFTMVETGKKYGAYPIDPSTFPKV